MASSNNNPWDDQASTNQQTHQQWIGDPSDQQSQASQNPWQLGDGTSQPQSHPSFTAQPDPWAQQQPSHYAPPPGPPPSESRSQQPRLPDETSRFVPESERSEQREALEHFEMSNHAQQSPDERNVETLTREFPSLDSALVAAIYGDSKDMGASREMLRELSGST